MAGLDTVSIRRQISQWWSGLAPVAAVAASG